MLALYRCGRQAEALQVYQDARRTLVEELGIEPGEPLRRLEQSILTHDPAIEPPASDSHVPRRAFGRGRGVGRQCSATSGCSSSSSPRQLSSPRLPPRSSPGAITPCRRRPSRATRSRSSTPARIGSRARSRSASRRRALAVGNGSLWVANTVDQSVSRIDLASRKVTRNIPVGGVPISLAVGRNAVWVVRRRPDGFPELIKIDPRFDVVGPGRRVLHGDPWAAASVAAGADAVWVAAEAGFARASRSCEGRRVTATVDTENSPTSVAVGAGAVWVGDARGNNVARIDPVTKLVIASIPVGDGADAVAVGAGAVWVADRLAGAVVRIDPATNSVTTTIPVGRSPTDIAVGLGSVWVANSRDGTVSRIDPVRDRVVKTIEVGGSPQAIAVGDGRVWVSVQTALVCPGVRTGDVACVDSAYGLDSLDPAIANTLPSWTIMYATCAGLFNYPDRPAPAGSRLEPEIAAALPVRSADGKTYTFTIRRGFRFSPPSNAPVTAQTFKFAIERALSPKITYGAGEEFRHGHRRRTSLRGREGEAHLGRPRARQHPHRPTDAPLPGHRLAARAAALLRRPARYADRGSRREPRVLGGTVLRRVVHTGSGRRAEAKSQLPRLAAACARRDRLQRRYRRGADREGDRGRHGRLRRRGRPSARTAREPRRPLRLRQPGCPSRRAAVLRQSHCSAS